VLRRKGFAYLVLIYFKSSKVEARVRWGERKQALSERECFHPPSPIALPIEIWRIRRECRICFSGRQVGDHARTVFPYRWVMEGHKVVVVVAYCRRTPLQYIALPQHNACTRIRFFFFISFQFFFVK
jgi:hypothetical protein